MFSGPDRLCVVVARTRHKMMQVELKEAANQGAKFLEVRLDFLTKAVEYKRLMPYKAAAWMATIRRPEDGGRWAGTETERLMVLRQAVVSGCFDWIDVETDLADQVKRFGTVKRVVSYHNLIETPANLDAIYDKMTEQDGDVFKLAVMPNTAADLSRILAIQKRAKKPTICFGMGDLGFPTRFTAMKFGAPWLYALFNADRELAPGMPAFAEFRTTYPVRRIQPDTKFFALVGDPVGHSLSPILHNHLFLRNKVNAFYLPFRVPGGQLTAAVEAMSAVPISGYSVTIPHKEAAAKLTSEHEAMVATISAANTLVLKPDAGFYSVNTDYPAILESLRTHFDDVAAKTNTKPREFAQMSAMILGAGGAARAAAFALHRAGAQVTITGRTATKAARLADDIGCKHVEWAARHNVDPCDVLVNGTPVGLFPNVDESPIHASFLKPEVTVFDTVYNPEQTLLIRQARERGCGTITGVEMFVRQAAKQFELFTDISPSLDMMRALVRKALSPLTKALDDEAQTSGIETEDES